MFQLHLVAVLGITTAISGSWARGSVIVDHPPHPYGGLGSDTAFLGPFSDPVWQRVADDFVLPAPAMISSLIAFGFYNDDNPPPTETMRVRFMRARPSDGLPDENNIVSETTFLNPPRVATGNIVFTGIGPHEYRYEMDFPESVALMSSQRYWLEFVQIGDLASAFRWESSAANLNGQAFINSITNDWRSTLPSGVVDTAYQLIAVPDLSSLILTSLGFSAILQKRGRKAGARGTR